MAHVWGEEDASDVGSVGDELADGQNGRGIATLDHTPNVDISLEPR